MTENKIEDAGLSVVAALRDDSRADLAHLLAEAFLPQTTAPRTTPAPLSGQALAAAREALREALSTLPDTFGEVAVSEPRALTVSEANAVIRERDQIDTLMSLLKRRKDETIREMLANHLDRHAEDAGLVDDTVGTDAKGHYLVRSEVPVEGSGMKVQGILSESKPQVSSARLAQLHEEGLISRKDYLALTAAPEVKRVFDPEKARKAVLSNPALIEALAQATEGPRKTLTVKVARDN